MVGGGDELAASTGCSAAGPLRRPGACDAPRAPWRRPRVRRRGSRRTGSPSRRRARTPTGGGASRGTVPHLAVALHHPVVPPRTRTFGRHGYRVRSADAHRHRGRRLRRPRDRCLPRAPGARRRLPGRRCGARRAPAHGRPAGPRAGPRRARGRGPARGAACAFAERRRGHPRSGAGHRLRGHARPRRGVGRRHRARRRARHRPDPDLPRAIVIRSTLLPGTAVDIAAEVRAIDPSVRIAHNPEFTREAIAVSDFLAPDRVVIGVDGHDDGGRRQRPRGGPAARLRAAGGAGAASPTSPAPRPSRWPPTSSWPPRSPSPTRSARLAAATGADAQAVVDGMGLDKRIGRSFLSPGPGFGGSCFPSQARALPRLAHGHGVQTPLMDAIWPSNVSAGRLARRRPRAAPPAAR